MEHSLPDLDLAHSAEPSTLCKDEQSQRRLPEGLQIELRHGAFTGLESSSEHHQTRLGRTRLHHRGWQGRAQQDHQGCARNLASDRHPVRSGRNDIRGIDQKMATALRLGGTQDRGSLLWRGGRKQRWRREWHLRKRWQVHAGDHQEQSHRGGAPWPWAKLGTC